MAWLKRERERDMDEQDFSREAAMTALLFWMDFESYLLLHLNARVFLKVSWFNRYFTVLYRFFFNAPFVLLEICGIITNSVSTRVFGSPKTQK